MMLFNAIMLAVQSAIMGASMMMAIIHADEMADAKRELKSCEYTEEREEWLKYDYETSKRGLISMILNSIFCLLLAYCYISELNI